MLFYVDTWQATKCIIGSIYSSVPVFAHLYRLSCVLIFDFVVLVLAILLSLATSMTVSIGLRVTCSAAKDSIKSHYPE